MFQWLPLIFPDELPVKTVCQLRKNKTFRFNDHFVREHYTVALWKVKGEGVKRRLIGFSGQVIDRKEAIIPGMPVCRETKIARMVKDHH